MGMFSKCVEATRRDATPPTSRPNMASRSCFSRLMDLPSAGCDSVGAPQGLQGRTQVGASPRFPPPPALPPATAGEELETRPGAPSRFGNEGPRRFPKPSPRTALRAAHRQIGARGGREAVLVAVSPSLRPPKIPVSGEGSRAVVRGHRSRVLNLGLGIRLETDSDGSPGPFHADAPSSTSRRETVLSRPSVLNFPERFVTDMPGIGEEKNGTPDGIRTRDLRLERAMS